MKLATRTTTLLLTATLAVASMPAAAHGSRGGAYGGHRGGVYVSGPGWGNAGLGFVLGLGLGTLAYDEFYRGPFVYPAPGVVVVPAPAPVAAAQPAPAVAATAPDPVIYPRNGQDARQTETDRQACNRWAVTLPSAMADASVFQRAIQACMDARGYSVR